MNIVFLLIIISLYLKELFNGIATRINDFHIVASLLLVLLPCEFINQIVVLLKI